MKVLTLNFLSCAVKACKSSNDSFPLHPKDAELVQDDIEINPDLLVNVLPRIDWAALRTTSTEVRLCLFPLYLISLLLFRLKVGGKGCLFFTSAPFTFTCQHFIFSWTMFEKVSMKIQTLVPSPFCVYILPTSVLSSAIFCTPPHVHSLIQALDLTLSTPYHANLPSPDSQGSYLTID